MEYTDKLPPGYAEEIEKLITAIRNTPDNDVKRKLFDDFTLKFTTLDYLWRRRINLEIPDDIHPISPETLQICLNLRQKAFKHFYCPGYLSEYPTKGDELRTLIKTKQFHHCYRLHDAECLWSFCPTNFKGPFYVLTAKKLEKYLTFPHSQLKRFYRFYQMNSAIPLPNEIEEKFEKAVKSYNYMLTIAMDPEKWLEWMYANFEEKYVVDNFECKIGEHWFMTEIWEYYIGYLFGKNRVEVLDIYRRYCRLFIKDENMRHNYFIAIDKFKSAGFDVTKWLIDQNELGYDFNIDYLKPGLQQLLNKNKYQICETCFLQKVKKCLPFSNDKDILKNASKQTEECIFCEVFNDEDNNYEEAEKIDTQIEEELAESLLALKATKIQYIPYVTIRFKNSVDPPIPVSLFNYIIENANHQILSKLYKTCKYFYVREKTLLCNFLYISQTYSQTFVKSGCFTKFDDFNTPNIRMFCSGISLHLQSDKIPDLATKCLPKLCLCSLKCLVLGSQKLSIDEFNIFISGGKIEQAQLRYTEIIKNDGAILSIEELFKMLPKVVDILLRPPYEMYTPETAYELSEMDRINKFESIKIYRIPETLSLQLFGKFLKKNLEPKATLGLKLDNSVGDEFRRNMNIFSAMLSLEWEPLYEAPIMV